MKKILFLILIVIFCSACGDKDEEVRPEWPFKFVVVNDGDETISVITLRTYIAYPMEDYTHLQGTIKAISKEGSLFLHKFDTLKICSDENVYPKCIVSLQVGVARDSLNEIGISQRFIYFRKTDTLKLPEMQSKMTVVWPRDSALFSLPP